jgi:shikimate kinase
MGSGKTTAGKLLAKKLGYCFADLDVLIEKQEGMAVTEIFALKGEDYFRKTEAEVLAGLLGRERLVIACGGGTPCFFDNMQKMKASGLTIYLKVSSGVLAQRLSAGQATRPLVAGIRGDRLNDHIRKLLAGREGWYRQCHIIYQADSPDTDELLDQIRSFPGYSTTL